MTDAVTISLISVGGTLVTLVVGKYIDYKINKIHKQINSRMDELLAAKRAEGNLEGRIDLKAEQKQSGNV